MELKFCALCDKEFGTEGVQHSREHIIPNSIGGQKKVRRIICKSCNDRTGAQWDSVLAQQLGFVSTLVQIQRDQGKQAPVEVATMSGKLLRKYADGHLKYPPEPPVLTKDVGGANIAASVSTMGEARKLLEGQKRHYPKLDVESELKKLKMKETYLPEPVMGSVHIGGNATGRSIVKSAFVMAVHSGVPPEQCEFARRYLVGDDQTFCWWFYYDRDVMTDRSPAQIFHCVAVMGNPITRQLLGYVEFFGAYRMLVLLSKQYHGEVFIRSYAVDPATGVELGLKLDLDIPAEEVITACAGGFHYVEGFKAALNWLMPIARDRSFTRERERIVKEAYREALSRLKVTPGERLSPEQAAEVTRSIMERLTPCLIHQQKALMTPIKPPGQPEDA